jgi:uncharacterized OB-fold protein
MSRKNNFKCSKCGSIKENPKGSYCRKCSIEYYRIYRLNRKTPNVNLDGLKDFIYKIEKSRYYIDFNDISTIIFFYQIITIDITEYDRYRTGKQIKMMWDKICNYYYKRINK